MNVKAIADCLHQGWQTSGSVRVVRLAFHLYTNGTLSVDDYESEDGRISISANLRKNCTKNQ